MTLVKTVNVTKLFQENSLPVKALENVSVAVEEKAFLVLCGPSGSGKTTLLNLIGCLDKPSSGAVFLDNEEVSAMTQTELTRFRLNRLGFIFQDYNLIPTLTALENVEYVLWLQGVRAGERRKRSLEICRRFGVDQLAHRRPWQLSRGQQQRIAVARAIVHRPRLVIGDELTANLDHKTGNELMAFLKELNRNEGISFIYATHDPVMMSYADKIVRLQDGRVLEADLR